MPAAPASRLKQLDSAVYFNGNSSEFQVSLHADPGANPAYFMKGEGKGMRGLGLRVDKEDQIEDALGEALAYKGPALVEIISDPGQT